jgi:hypothetical protein
LVIRQKKVGAYIKLQKHKARDKAPIALSQPYEVRYWSKKFKITPRQAQSRSQSRRPFVEKGRCLSGEKEKALKSQSYGVSRSAFTSRMCGFPSGVPTQLR